MNRNFSKEQIQKPRCVGTCLKLCSEGDWGTRTGKSETYLSNLERPCFKIKIIRKGWQYSSMVDYLRVQSVVPQKMKQNKTNLWKKLLNFISYQENANQNCDGNPSLSEVSSHTSTYSLTHKFWGGRGEKGTFIPCQRSSKIVVSLQKAMQSFLKT